MREIENKNSSETAIYESVVKNMAEGVLTISADGKITSVNHACKEILSVDNSIIGASFAVTFIGKAENDAFNQTILNAIYNYTAVQRNIVNYVARETVKKLYVTTSYLKSESENNGIIVVVNDLSELYELKDAVKAMEQIKLLNDSLKVRNQLISKTFGRYLSDEIVQKILDAPDGGKFGGEKREVTIIMSDLRGFTAMSEIMQPVDLMTMLNHYLAEMTVIIEHYKGMIIEFIGDAIFAIFGEPVTCNNHVLNAMQCAIEMQNAMSAVNAFNEKCGYPNLQMGIGIHTGEVIIGNIGSERRAKYGVVGQNVNLAGRIEGYTVGQQILASENVVQLVKGVSYRSRNEIHPKGIQKPIYVYDITAVGKLVCNIEIDEMEQLEIPKEIEIIVYEGKYAKNEKMQGHILATSNKRMKLDIKMELYTNVCLKYEGQEIMGKYIESDMIQIVKIEKM